MEFGGATVLCLGDLMLDRFVHGDIERISPEAPIPVLRLRRTDEMLGGAGNVAHNIAALGGRSILVGLVGEDERGAALRRLAGAIPGIEPRLLSTPHRPTICKTRFIAAQQQVVRADEESSLALQADELAGLIAAVDGALPQAACVILSDYGKSLLAPPLIAHAMDAARAQGIAVFVDPKSDDFSRYRGAACITPNLRELALASRMPVDDDAQVERAARRVMKDAEAQAIVVTRSERGMMLVAADGPVRMAPAVAREVFDVSGAGDTAVAALALAHASGLTLDDAMRVANAAAGVVVSKRGTATATVAEVLHELERQEQPAGRDLPGLRSLGAAHAMVARWKGQGLRVGFTNGCFDILHPGHVALLRAARAACDRLVVALNTDASVRRLKGPARPVNELAHRAQVVAALADVDCVVSFDEPTPHALIGLLRPALLVKGADYALADVVGADIVEADGGRVMLAPISPGHSTTGVLARIARRGQLDQRPAPAHASD